MKQLHFSGLFLLVAGIAGLFLLGHPAQAQDLNSLRVESHLFVKVHEMTLADYNRLVEVIAREPAITLEYGCVEFGLLALKFKHNSLAEPDVKAYVIGLIAPVLSGKKTEVLHLETRKTAADRC